MRARKAGLNEITPSTGSSPPRAHSRAASSAAWGQSGVVFTLAEALGQGRVVAVGRAPLLGPHARPRDGPGPALDGVVAGHGQFPAHAGQHPVGADEPAGGPYLVRVLGQEQVAPGAVAADEGDHGREGGLGVGRPLADLGQAAVELGPGVAHRAREERPVELGHGAGGGVDAGEAGGHESPDVAQLAEGVGERGGVVLGGDDGVGRVGQADAGVGEHEAGVGQRLHRLDLGPDDGQVADDRQEAGGGRHLLAGLLEVGPGAQQLGSGRVELLAGDEALGAEQGRLAVDGGPAGGGGVGQGEAGEHQDEAAEHAQHEAPAAAGGRGGDAGGAAGAEWPSPRVRARARPGSGGANRRVPATGVNRLAFELANVAGS